MNVFRGLILVIMAVTVKGDTDSGLKMTCPRSPLHTAASEAYCTVNITRIVEQGCVLEGGYVNIELVYETGINEITDADCMIVVDTGLCVTNPRYCPHCHEIGVSETRVYFSSSLSEDSVITCRAHCRPRPSPTSNACALRKQPSAVVATIDARYDPQAPVQLQCPSNKLQFPFTIPCQLDLGVLKERNCTTTKGHKPYTVVNVFQALMLGAYVSGIHTTGASRECQVELQDKKCVVTGDCSCEVIRGDVVMVLFEYNAYYAKYGSLITSCRASCPPGDGDVFSASFCYIRFTMPAYLLRLPESPHRRWGVKMRCPSTIPAIPFTVFCMVNVTQLNQENCFKSGEGVHRVDLINTMYDPRTVGETTTCYIKNFQGIYLCDITPQCPICRQQGKGMFYIPFRVTSRHAQFNVHLIHCRTRCDEFFTFSKCETYFTPGAGEP